MENIKAWPVTKFSFHWDGFMSMNRSADMGFSLGSIGYRNQKLVQNGCREGMGLGEAELCLGWAC